MTWLAYSHLGVAKKVTLTTQPSGAIAGEPFTTQPAGKLVDGSGVLSRTSGTTITASKASGTGTLSGTLTQDTVDGLFAFTDLEMDTITAAVTLGFAAPGLTSATSNSFNVTTNNKIIGMAQGIYTLTGTAVTFAHTHAVVVDPATFTVTGSAVTLRNNKLAAAAGSYTVTGSAVTLTGGGSTEPTPSGTILFDGRAGGAQDFQSISTMPQLLALGFQQGADVFCTTGIDTNYDGNGKHAIRFDWQTNIGAQSNATLVWYFNAHYKPFCFSVVIHLGKTASGGGNGVLGAFDASLSSTSKAKRFLFYPNQDSGTGRYLWYWDTNGQATGTHKLESDSAYFWSGADYGVGQDVRWTFQVDPGTPSVMRQWRNGVLMDTNNNADISSTGIIEIQFPTNRWNTVQNETEYWTDLVMWSP